MTSGGRKPVARKAASGFNAKTMAVYGFVGFFAMLLGAGVVIWLIPGQNRAPEVQAKAETNQPDNPSTMLPEKHKPMAVETEAAKPQKTHEAWYKTQAEPPAMITTEREPILPENLPPLEMEPDGNKRDDAGSPADLIARPRAYEEALPETVYTVPEVLVPMVEAPETAVISTAPMGDHKQDAPKKQASTAVAAWESTALDFVVKPDQPMIAIVIDDMGLDLKHTRDILALPGPLTVSYLTYAENLASQIGEAWAKGHEVMGHVSMEPSSLTIDPGPNVLMTSQSKAEIRKRLVDGLDRAGPLVGINNHMGSKFTANPEVMAVVMDVLAQRGLMFLDSRTSGRTAGPAIAQAYGVPHLVRNVFLDNDNDKEAILKNLAKTENIAKKHGFAIAIGHPRSGTIEALTEWLPRLAADGLQLVPVTALLKRQRQVAQAVEPANSLANTKTSKPEKD